MCEDNDVGSRLYMCTLGDPVSSNEHALVLGGHIHCGLSECLDIISNTILGV